MNVLSRYILNRTGWILLSAFLIPCFIGMQSASAQSQDKDEILINFRNAPLESVLDYLSKAAGFVIVLDTQISGNVDMWSHQPLNKDEAVDLLNTVLNRKGFAAIRNGRTLTIVKRDDAKKRDLPVKVGSDPEVIPKNDEMVTQIIPVRYTDAVKLLQDLDPLLPSYATVSANESSNAVVLTDTQSNIRRMTEIIRALDTSISSISTVRVFALTYAEATELADVITEIFEIDDSSQNNRSGRGGGRFGPRFGPGSEQEETTDSEARKAASRVVAVGDERTNSLVVGAPEELMPMIEKLVDEVDTEAVDTTEVRVFRLENADPAETVEIITEIFPDENQSTQQQDMPRFGRGGPFGGGSPMGGGSSSSSSSRTVQDYTVYAVADTRTKSVIVSAAQDTMLKIEKMIEQLDSDTSRKQKVFIYRLENADVENVAEILRAMFEEQTIGTSSSSSTESRNNLNNFSGSSASQTTSTRQSSGM